MVGACVTLRTSKVNTVIHHAKFCKAFRKCCAALRGKSPGGAAQGRGSKVSRTLAAQEKEKTRSTHAHVFLHLSDTSDSIPREQVVRGAGRGEAERTNQRSSYKSGTTTVG